MENLSKIRHNLDPPIGSQTFPATAQVEAAHFKRFEPLAGQGLSEIHFLALSVKGFLL